LKQEVTEAWDHYKQAQERAAARESELQDEIKQIQKVKAVDKQQAVQQITKFQDDISLLTKQLQTITEEKQALKLKIEEYDMNNGKWEEKVQKLKDDLQEARMSTIQGAQTIREELRATQLQNEQLRNDHANIMRQMQVRQQEAEKENQELMKVINDYQRELTRLKNSYGLQSSSIGFSTDKSYTTEDFVTVQKELFQVAQRYEKEHELLEEKDRELKRLEREFKALQINYEDEKKNSQDLSSRLNESLQKLNLHTSLLSESNNRSSDSLHPDAKVVYESAIADLKKQAESLSQLLLKRQASVLELQAERSSLKSRVSDLQSRFVVYNCYYK
jgi:chromosome segregation ATPase